jgi:hypothetical protein
MRYELTDFEGAAIRPYRPNKPRDPSLGALASAMMPSSIVGLPCPSGRLRLRDLLSEELHLYRSGIGRLRCRPARQPSTASGHVPRQQPRREYAMRALLS